MKIPAPPYRGHTPRVLDKDLNDARWLCPRTGPFARAQNSYSRASLADNGHSSEINRTDDCSTRVLRVKPTTAKRGTRRSSSLANSRAAIHGKPLFFFFQSPGCRRMLRVKPEKSGCCAPARLPGACRDNQTESLDRFYAAACREYLARRKTTDNPARNFVTLAKFPLISLLAEKRPPSTAIALPESVYFERIVSILGIIFSSAKKEVCFVAHLKAPATCESDESSLRKISENRATQLPNCLILTRPGRWIYQLFRKV